MPEIAATVSAIIDAEAWNARVRLVQQIPEEYGRAHLAAVYSRLAKELYVSQLAPTFAYVHWRDTFELPSVEVPYSQAYAATQGFTRITRDDISSCLREYPSTIRIFRLILGFTPSELAAATKVPAVDLDAKAVTSDRIKRMEDGSEVPSESATVLAETITRGVARDLFPAPFEGQRSKQDRPDLANDWETIREYARDGVPLAIYLHQRHYGGAFRQLLDSTSRNRGDILEDEVESLLTSAGVPYIRTGGSNQSEIADRFNLTVRPTPDFVFFDAGDSLRGILECKAANDGGTARDKSDRFRSLRAEADRLGGPPVFAVLGGLGWTRTKDALGPVVRECDGRVFTLATLPEMLTVDPLPSIAGLAASL